MPLDPALFVERLRAVAPSMPRPAPAGDGAGHRLAGAALVVDVQGPRDRSYSLGIVNHRLADALARQPGVRVCAAGAVSGATHVVRNTYPPVVDDLDPRQRNYLYFAWEDSRIPADWAAAFNRHLDGILVPSTHVRDVLARSGVAVAVGIVPYGVDAEPGIAGDTSALALPTRKRFRFLHVSTGFPRKGCDVLLRAFTREFSRRDDVCLIVKTLPHYDHPTTRRVWWARLRRPGGPEILHIDRALDAVAMRRLYRAASCLIHPARAEGFGLPVAEAMLAEIPVIVTGYSGPADFCSDDTAVVVGYRLVASRSPFVVKDAEWAEPDETELRRAMRRVYDQAGDGDLARRIANAAAHVRANFTWDRAAARSVAFVRAVDTVSGRPVRAGMVTTWNQRCEIAEYSRQLIAAVPDAAVQWSILAPETVDTVRPDGPDVVRCWREDWPVDLTRVVAEADRRDLELVNFQTHLTMWGAAETAALTALRRAGRHVFVTLHSIHGARPVADVVRGLRAIDRILVHSEADRRRLTALGLTDNVTALPRGFPSGAGPARDELRRALGLGAWPTVGTVGFLRPHDGLLELIEAVALLRRRHPDVQLLALTATSPSAVSAAYSRRCVDVVARLRMSDRCRIVTDFLDADACRTALAACDVVALPYRPGAESASAAMPIALAARIPVVATASPAFDDVRDLVFPLARVTPRAIARGLVAALRDHARAAERVAATEHRLGRDGWEVIGRTYAKFVTAAVTDLTAFAQPYRVGGRPE